MLPSRSVDDAIMASRCCYHDLLMTSSWHADAGTAVKSTPNRGFERAQLGFRAGKTWPSLLSYQAYIMPRFEPEVEAKVIICTHILNIIIQMICYGLVIEW